MELSSDLKNLSRPMTTQATLSIKSRDTMVNRVVLRETLPQQRPFARGMNIKNRGSLKDEKF